ncbi:DNA polymerase Y family protein [Curvibacter sp. HBC28]|uniref:DNA polymerase Y family protein n=1 Tax=Curvibacter microcysteis TaxID=3026419 RepID=A0ABT5MJP4_9BURK|nr:DNA polymerase Y family protein [Curvibacter sp. HBC28]MDD0815415.1 DNA polymerase Y family protein [Curvibacter sp. HBC28]
MWWIALLPAPQPEAVPLAAERLAPHAGAAPGESVLSAEQAQRRRVWWALRYTPRVACVDGAVLMELQASLRLFGGDRALLRRVLGELQALGVDRLGLAPTGRAALALARSLPVGSRRARRCRTDTLAATLDPLPLDCLSEAGAQAALLSRLGCRSLGQLRALPRGGVARRFGASLLRALDQAYGQQSELFAWESLPEQFEPSCQLPEPEAHSAALGPPLQGLLQQLQDWLAVRQAGATGVCLSWQHDPRRGCAPRGELSVHSAQPSRDGAHWLRLLSEHLARVAWEAPVQALSLRALGVQAWSPDTHSLLPQDQHAGEPLAQCLERLAARLGPQRVLQGALQADHRPQHRQRWWPAATPLPAARPPTPSAELGQALGWGQPAWLLPQPQALRCVGERPHYHGALALLAGPERIETGWWDASATADADLTLRDYFIARSAQAGLLWVFRVRTGTGTAAEPSAARWFLHGVFG